MQYYERGIGDFTRVVHVDSDNQIIRVDADPTTVP